jgi:cell division protein ZapA (FtsZ GTPase activity inhibitor)
MKREESDCTTTRLAICWSQHLAKETRDVAMKNHKVVLGGTGFMIRSDVDEKRIRKIESYLNAKLDKVSGRGQRINFTDSLVLVMFHVADLMMDGSDNIDTLRKTTAGQVRELRTEIDDIQQMIQRRLESTEDTIS